MNHRHTNILRVYHQSTAGEIAAGLQWYAAAHEEAYRIRVGLQSLEISAAIIAAVSPGLRWERNIEAAERIIRGEELTGLGIRWYEGVRKAKRILAGRPPLSVLKGPKVRAFYDCILDPEHTLSVCIDGHAYSIWAGQRIKLDDIPPFNDRLYSRISGDYWAVARHVGIRPCQLQAITWCTWRRLHVRPVVR
jgi:hypothetical protein